MGAGALMSIGVTSLHAAYAGLQVTGHNIANANVAGFSRQKLELATAPGQFSAAGYFGKGVDVTSVSRAYNELLAREANTTDSAARLDASRLDMLQRLERIFKPGEQGLGHAAGQFLNAMVDLAAHPADASTREVVLARGQEMAWRFADAGRQLGTLQRSISADLGSQIAEVNQLSANIAQSNRKIAQAHGLGQPPNDLLDERDRLLARLNGIMQVQTVQAPDGSTSVFLAGGHTLVLADAARPLMLMADDADPSRAAIGVMNGSTPLMIEQTLLGGGTAAGLLRFQNADLVDARNLVGRMAAAVAGAVNAQQQLGVNLHRPFGSVASEPIFEVGAPNAIPHAANLRDAGGGFVGKVAMVVTTPSALRASDYQLRADPGGLPGQWQITRLADGQVRTIASGDEVDGFRVDIGPPDPDPGDSFLLQPVGAAALDMRLLLDDVRDLAAASPLVATAVPTSTGTVGIDSLRMLTAPPAPDHTVRITFTDDIGNYTWDLIDGGGTVVSSASGLWQPGAAIPTPPTDMNGFALTLLGVPRTGDVVLVEPTDPDHFTQNNGNAMALSELRDALIVDGATATDAYAAAMADIGVRVQGARSTSLLTTAVAEQAAQARDSESGVNLDEEAARLIQFQQAYQAAAKVLQAAQTVMDTLLQAVGGR